MRVYLHGELGAGKTTLIRGLLRHLGVRDRVKSPSYALVELYAVSRLNLYHFDFYRFISPHEFGAAGFADYFAGDGVCLVEWPEKAAGVLPPPDLELWFTYANSGRNINIDAFTEAAERCLTELHNA
jgi:tRNA threonylcarbamoyladenosine biosynthesis protein TsaE